MLASQVIETKANPKSSCSVMWVNFEPGINVAIIIFVRQQEYLART